jgi:hypothetical protein
MQEHRRAHSDDSGDEDHKQSQSHAQPFIKSPELKQLQYDGALLVQMLGLNLNEMTLLVEISGSLSR